MKLYGTGFNTITNFIALSDPQINSYKEEQIQSFFEILQRSRGLEVTMDNRRAFYVVDGETRKISIDPSFLQRLGDYLKQQGRDLFVVQSPYSHAINGRMDGVKTLNLIVQ